MPEAVWCGLHVGGAGLNLSYSLPGRLLLDLGADLNPGMRCIPMGSGPLKPYLSPVGRGWVPVGSVHVTLDLSSNPEVWHLSGSWVWLCSLGARGARGEPHSLSPVLVGSFDRLVVILTHPGYLLAYLACLFDLIGLR